jgi:hypothetical protein
MNEGQAKVRKGNGVCMRLSDRERDALDRMASAEWRKRSDMIRVIIRREAERLGLWPEEAA